MVFCGWILDSHEHKEVVHILEVVWIVILIDFNRWTMTLELHNL